MKKNRILLRFSATLAAILLLVSVFLSVEAHSDYDFSKPTSPYNKEIGADELLDIYGTEISDVEREYLRAYPALTLKYDDTVTTAYITTELSGTTLSIIAKPYVYTAAMGDSVSWIPKSAALGQLNTSFTPGDGAYTAELGGVVESEHSALSLKVTYELDVEIDTATLNLLINQAYNDAPLWIAFSEYLGKMDAYREEYAEYESYLKLKYAYDDALADYNRYLDDLAAYHAAVENNENYDSAMLEYNEKLLLYREYIDKLEDYEAELLEYEAYLARCKRLQDQLSAIEAAGLAMTDGRKVYSAIMGGTVTEVLENKHLFTGSTIGADPALIDSAAIATEALRVLLPEYFGYETFEERYAYYITNYDAFRDNFVLLLQSLDGLYRSGKVREVLISQEKDRKYIILVAQLAYISNALSDSDIRSYYGEYSYGESFTIEGKTVPEILEYKSYLVDTGSAYPDPEGYPLPVAEPISPEPVAEPKKPVKVEIPAYPQAVEDPGEGPEPMTEPKEPDTVLPPRGGSSLVAMPPAAEALVEAYLHGTLQMREPCSAPFTLTLTKDVAKKVFGATHHTVFFYNESGDEILYTTTADTGTIAAFDGALPEKAPTTEEIFEFDAWVDGEGNKVNLESVSSDLILFPSFKKFARPYPITFVFDGNSVTEDFPYGTVPTPSFVPQKGDDGDFGYVFCGWEGGLLPVTSAASYTATFEKVYILPTSGGGAAISIDNGTYTADATSSNDSSFDLSGLLMRVSASHGGGLNLLTRFGGLSISYSTVLDMVERGVARVTLSAGTIPYGRTYKISFYDEAGNEISEKYTMTATMPYHGISADGALLSYLDTDGGKVYVRHAPKDGYVTFNLSGNTEYTYAVERSINLLASQNVTLSVASSGVRPGDTVTVEYVLAPGMKLDKMYMIASDGTETIIRAGTFVMPDDDITIWAKTSVAKYKIVFKDGERVLSSHSYAHGSSITAPPTPSKVNDGTYRYVFIGWGDVYGNPVDVTDATADTTYYAVYERELLPERGPEGLMISDRFLRPIVTGTTLLFVTVLGVIPSATLSLIFTIRLRRRRKTK